MGKIEARLVQLFEKTPLLRSIDLEQSGIKRIEISRYVAAGELRRLRRGLYCLPNYRQNEHGDLAIVGKQIPEAVICLLSALRYHELTTQAPVEIWIAIDRKARAPSLKVLSLRVVRFGQASLRHGVELKSIEGVPVRITSVEKTIADCFKYRSKVGLDVALEALKDATRRKLISQNELWSCAKIDRVTNVMRPYLEALV
ncbi:MAG: type IV toxin-antitoxin system AbiEi family antitoxin domain-containing protein [Rectinemataceae bacterium]